VHDSTVLRIGGTQQLGHSRSEADLDWLVRKLEAKPPVRVPGTAVFMTAQRRGTPPALAHNSPTRSRGR
jgi:K+ transporter